MNQRKTPPTQRKKESPIAAEKDDAMNGVDAGDEETIGLFPNACKVVEYLEPVMSRDLLHKFPDSSSLGFDYSQSSIWSPLLPRSHFPVDSGCFATPRKLCFGAARKKKINLSMSNKKKMMKTRKKSAKVSDTSLTPTNVACAPFAKKGWDKVLKAASKHFKKKKRDATAHVKLSNYLKG